MRSRHQLGSWPLQLLLKVHWEAASVVEVLVGGSKPLLPMRFASLKLFEFPYLARVWNLFLSVTLLAFR